MKCPHCGFRHLSPATHCARCKKPLPEAAPNDFPPALFDDRDEPAPEPVKKPAPTIPAPATPPVRPAPSAPKKMRDPMEYDPDLSLSKTSALSPEDSEEITAVLSGLDPDAAAVEAQVAAPEPPAPTPVVKMPPALPVAAPAPAAAPIAPAPAPRDPSMPGISDDSLLQDFHSASGSDWSEGRKLDTFFGTPPDKVSGPAVSAPDPDLSVIRIRDDADDASAPSLVHPDTVSAPRPPSMLVDPDEVSVLRPGPASAPKPPAGPAPAVLPPPRDEPPPDTADPSFFQRSAGRAPALLPFGERSGATGEASVYGTRSLRRPPINRGPLARRALAGMVDFLLVGAVGYGLVRAALWLASRGQIYGSLHEWVALIGLPALLMTAVLAVTWQSLFLLLAGRTPGMALAGLEFPGRLTPVRIVLRSLFLAVEVIPLGIGLLLGYRGAGLWLHDRVAGARPERRIK